MHKDIQTKREREILETKREKRRLENDNEY